MSLLRAELQVSDDDFPLETTFFSFSGSLRKDLPVYQVVSLGAGLGWAVHHQRRAGPHKGSAWHTLWGRSGPWAPTAAKPAVIPEPSPKPCQSLQSVLRTKRGPGFELGQSSGSKRSPGKPLSTPSYRDWTWAGGADKSWMEDKANCTVRTPSLGE